MAPSHEGPVPGTLIATAHTLCQEANMISDWGLLALVGSQCVKKLIVVRSTKIKANGASSEARFVEAICWVPGLLPKCASAVPGVGGSSILQHGVGSDIA